MAVTNAMVLKAYLRLEEAGARVDRARKRVRTRKDLVRLESLRGKLKQAAIKYTLTIEGRS